MGDFLESLLGPTGALVAQLVLTVVIVLVLIAAVYWLIRRLSRMRLGGIGRGRVPRLAVVDAMAIDNRRRLVLVRRDNVEHLIMIGGPADLVVEPSIVRTRPRAPPVRQGEQPPAAAQPPSAPPAARAPPPVGPDATAGYPPVLVPPTRGFAPAPTMEEPTAHPFQRAQRPADGRRPAEPGEAPRPAPIAAVRAEAAAPSAREPLRPGEMSDDPDVPHPGPAADTTSPVAGAASPAEPGTDGDERVSDLEQDMARLLGEINAKRSSV